MTKKVSPAEAAEVFVRLGRTLGDVKGWSSAEKQRVASAVEACVERVRAKETDPVILGKIDVMARQLSIILGSDLGRRNPYKNVTFLEDAVIVPEGTHGPKIYFYRAGDRVKIGRSWDPDGRPEAFRGLLTLMGCLTGGVRDEGELHARFKQYRVKGTREVYEIRGELRDWLIRVGLLSEVDA